MFNTCLTTGSDVKRHGRAFTMIELMMSVAIIAMIVSAAIFFIVGYVNETRTTAKKVMLSTLNEALTRYKTQGGGTAGLTIGASIGRVLRQLKTPINWTGQVHQFLNNSLTIPARSLQVVGNYATFRFSGYNGYQAEAAAAGGEEEE